MLLPTSTRIVTCLFRFSWGSTFGSSAAIKTFVKEVAWILPLLTMGGGLLVDGPSATTLCAATSFPLSTIRSGVALNRIIEFVQPNDAELQRTRLTLTELNHIRLKSREIGVPFSVTTGMPLEICFPPALHEHRFRDAVNRFAEARGLFTLSIANRNGCKRAEHLKLRSSVEMLASIYRDAPHSLGRSSKTIRGFIRDLQEEVELVIHLCRHLDSHKSFSGRSVADLLSHMRVYDLEFAPPGCRQEGYAVYEKLCRLLAQKTTKRTLDDKTRRELRTIREKREKQQRRQRIAQRNQQNLLRLRQMQRMVTYHRQLPARYAAALNYANRVGLQRTYWINSQRRQSNVRRYSTRYRIITYTY